MTQYDFSYEFQADVLRLMAHDPEFLTGMRKAVEPTYFSDPELAVVAEAMLKIFDETHGRPSLGMTIEVIEEVADAGDDHDEIQDLARAAFQQGLPQDCAMIRERVVEFGKRSRMQEVLLQGQDFLAEGDFAGYQEAVREAITVAADNDAGVYDYYETLQRRLQAAVRRDAECIPTGVAVLDKHLPDGGLAKGEMGLLMGLPGYGKTTSLINFGYGALAAGKTVLHISVGDMSEWKVANRYDSRITGRDIVANRMAPEATLRDVGAFLDETGGRDRLIIKFFPSNRVTVPQLEQYMRWLEASRGFKADLLIVDYGANMAPRQKYEGKLVRLAHEEIYKDLRALGAVMNCAVWSAIQANRGAFNLDAPGMGEAAEAFGPMRDTDVAIGIGNKPEERDEGWIRFRGAKVRDSEAEWNEMAGVDFAKHTIYERDDFDDDEDEDDDDLG